MIASGFPGANVYLAARIDEAQGALGRCQPPSLLLLDHAEGIAIAPLCRRLPEANIVVLFGKSRVEAALEALDAGACGYVPESIGMDGVQLILKLILSGERYIPPLVVDGWAPGEHPTIAAGGRKESERIRALSHRQRQILALVSNGASNKEIARTLDIGELTVKSHMRAIFRLMSVSSRTEAASVALLAGIGRDLPNVE